MKRFERSNDCILRYVNIYILPLPLRAVDYNGAPVSTVLSCFRTFDNYHSCVRWCESLQYGTVTHTLPSTIHASVVCRNLSRLESWSKC